MLSSTIITPLLLSLTQIRSGIAQPVNDTSFIVTHAASQHFPHSKGDLSYFDVDVRYVGYDAATQSWLTSLNPATGTNDEEKAKIIIEAAYAKPFNANDPDMTADVNSMLATVAGNHSTSSTSLEKRDGSSFQVASAHAIKWSACASILSCLSGTTCSFNLNIGKAPRSQCQAVAGSNCCISWSDYTVRAGFFQSTWTICDNEVKAQGQTSAYCEGYGSSSQGGDVCLSNRASGCT